MTAPMLNKSLKQAKLYENSAKNSEFTETERLPSFKGKRGERNISTADQPNATQGKFKKAVGYLIKAKHINPNDTHTNDSLREAYIKLGIFFQSEGEFT